jgi:hypothetical protein
VAAVKSRWQKNWDSGLTIAKKPTTITPISSEKIEVNKERKPV